VSCRVDDADILDELLDALDGIAASRNVLAA
jgi:hypothetical protein